MEWIDYFNILILVHLFLQLTFSIFILYKTYRILIIKNIFSKATISMILYFCFTAFLSFTLGLYSIFAIIFWRPDTVLANPTTLYIIGFIPWILICVNPVCEFFLCLERIFTILFPYQYLEKSKKLMAGFTCSCVLGCLLFNLFMNEFTTKVSQLPEQRCRFFTCFTIFIPEIYLIPFKIFIST